MPIHTMELELNEVLFHRLEQAARPAGVSVSEFVLQLLKRWFGEMTIAELEQQEVEAYQQMPVVTGEFDVWEPEQAW
ncbi:MAG: hypothetical protein U0350_46615 [Caldilineaceae bacterium]